MDRNRKLLIATSGIAGVTATLALGPADALLASETTGLTSDSASSTAASTTSSSSTDTSGSVSAASVTTSTTSATSTKISVKTTTATSTATKKVTGTASIAGGRYGTMKLTVTLTKGKITKIDYSKTSVNDNRSYQINVSALPTLVKRAISKQSAKVSGVSGASYTTMAFKQALQSALTKAGK